MAKIVRRAFLLGSVAIAGGVAFGYYKVSEPYPNPLEVDLGDDEAAITPYVLVNSDGVTIIAPRAEMGQGVRTTLAALVAEELDIDLDDVNVEQGPASSAYYNALGLEEAAPFPVTDNGLAARSVRDVTHIIAKVMGRQLTGGSTSTPDAFDKMRKAGAAARIVLVKAAARKLSVKARELTTKNGAVIAPDGTKIPYTELALAARDISPPKDPKLKDRSEWRILGKTQNKVDMTEKSTGKAMYASDVRLPNMVFATILANPNIGAPINSVNDGDALKVSGVRKTLKVGSDAVAVLASNTWAAMQGAKALKVDWAAASYLQSTAEIRAAMEAALDGEPTSQNRDDGNITEALGDGQTIEASYHVPYLAHATMEPMSAAALLNDDRLDIWVGTQSPTDALALGSELSGLATEKVHVHTTYLGGAFGRRSEMDYIAHAVKIAIAEKGTPVSMVWSREEDMRHDVYRTMAHARFKGAVKDGAATAFDLHLASSPTALDAFSRRGMDLSMADPTVVQNAWDNPYTVPNYRVSGYEGPVALPLGFWRSVGASQNGFFQESAMDELAFAAGADPLEFRLANLKHEPSRGVLERVRDMSGWGRRLEKGHGLGVAYYLSFGVPTAEVFEVAVTPAGIRLVGIWAAVDVGIALDPGNIEAQVQGGIVYGITAAMFGEITVEGGKVQQSNFHDYEMLRINQCPPIEVAVLEQGPRIRGIGEPGTPPAAPALANAIFSATGERIRELPLKHAVNFI